MNTRPIYSVEVSQFNDELLCNVVGIATGFSRGVSMLALEYANLRPFDWHLGLLAESGNLTFTTSRVCVYAESKWGVAFDHYTSAAKMGNGEAMCRLAKFYLWSYHVVTCDWNKAQQLLESAASLGAVEAPLFQGLLKWEQIRKETCSASARKNRRQLFEKSSGNSALANGWLMLEVDDDCTTFAPALELHIQGQVENDPQSELASALLAMLRSRKQSCLHSYVDACNLATTAAALAPGNCMLQLLVHNLEDELERSRNPDIVDEGNFQRKEAVLLTKLVRWRYPPAMHRICYLCPRRVAILDSARVELLEDATSQGYIHSYVGLAMWHAEHKRAEEYHQLLKQAAHHGDAFATYVLACAYEDGKLIAVDLQRAVACYRVVVDSSLSDKFKHLALERLEVLCADW